MADYTQPSFNDGIRTSINQAWNPKEFLKWIMLPKPGVLSSTPWLDRIFSNNNQMRLEEQWLNTPLLSRTDVLTSSLDIDDLTIVVGNVSLYRIRQILKLVSTAGAEFVRVSSINYGTNTLTIDRGHYGSTPCVHDKANTVVFILPPTRAEYETNLADNSLYMDALPTEIKYNYGMGFSVSEKYTDVVEAFERQNDLRLEPQLVFESVIAKMRAEIELQSLIGIPYKASAAGNDSSMGGLFHYISTNNTTDLTANGGDGKLKWTHINNAVKSIVRGGGRPDFILCDIDTQQELSENWSDARIMGMSGPDGTIGYSLGTIRSAISNITLNFLAMDQIPADTFVICCSDKVQLGPVAGLGPKRLIKEPDGINPNTYITYQMFVNMRLQDSDKYFHKITFTSVNDEYM